MDYNNNNQFPNQEYSASTNEYFSRQTPEAQKKSKVPVVIGSVAGVAAVGVGAFALANFFGGGPVADIAKAAQNTIDKGSFAIEINSKYSYEDEYNNSEEETSIEGAVILDRDDLAFDLECETQSAFDTGEESEQTYRYICYDNKIAPIFPDDDYIDYYEIEQEYIDYAFEFYELLNFDSLEESDFEGIIKLIEDISGEDISDDFDDDDIENIKSFIKAYQDKLNDDAWLEEYLGFEEDGHTYTFTPDFKALAEDVVEALEEHLEDTLDDMDIDIKDLEDAFEYINDDNNFTVSVTLDGNYIESIAIESKSEYDDFAIESTYEINISDIGSASVDTDELEEIMESANESTNPGIANANAKTVYTAAATYVVEYAENPEGREVPTGCSGIVGESGWVEGEPCTTLAHSIDKYLGQDAEGTYWSVYCDDLAVYGAFWSYDSGGIIGSYPDYTYEDEFDFSADFPQGGNSEEEYDAAYSDIHGNP
ncbi:MAG: hypothetical protein IJO29_00135 [Oscillospiraceae bacterium]|nr:hypothetical protein [Oscillospiraceae bacterium]